jgi:hypothetical protein
MRNVWIAPAFVLLTWFDGAALQKETLRPDTWFLNTKW